jgi:hypothetical protein
LWWPRVQNVKWIENPAVSDELPACDSPHGTAMDHHTET